MKAKLLMMIVLASILVSGCSSPNKTAPQMEQDEVIVVANAKAIEEGFNLSKYNLKACHYQFTKRNGTWSVFFEMKPPAPPGGHFHVTVDDQTKTTTLMRGE